MIRTSGSCALAIAVLSIATIAQVGPTNSSAEKEAPAVSEPFFADYGHGKPAHGIKPADLTILDNKKPPLSVAAVRTAQELPLRLGVLIDTSNSQRSSRLYQPGIRAVSNLLNQMVVGADDKVFMVNFASKPDGTDFMNRSELIKYKTNLIPGGGTALYDALYFAARSRMKGDPTWPARRALIVLSDGDDNLSHVTHDIAIAAAQEARAVVFAVSTSESQYDNIANKALQQFADKTGGRVFLHLSAKDLPEVFLEIKDLIDDMNLVTYVPAERGSPGQYHSFELSAASDKKLKLHSPKGYYVTVRTP